MTEEELFENRKTELYKIEIEKENNAKKKRDIEAEEEVIHNIGRQSEQSIEILSAQWGESREIYEMRENFNHLLNVAKHDFYERRENLEKELKELRRKEETVEEVYRKEKEKLTMNQETEEEDDTWG